MRTRVLLVLLCVSALGAGASGQGQTPGLQAFLRTQLSLSDAEWSSFDQGHPVVKTLSSTMKREMTTVGGVRIEGTAMARFVEQFKTLEGFRTSQFVLQLGKFGEQPALGDLDPLTLEAEDVASLKKCRVGACDVQLSAADILRFNREVDWEAASASTQASTVYKSVLFAHLSEYRTEGGARLVAYHDQAQPVALTAETSALLDVKPSLLDYMPIFQSYIRRYPASPPAHVEDFFYWSKEAFGFKPVVGLNHVSVYAPGGRGDVIIATTQIYASHYMDGSVAVNAIIPDPRNGAPGFYWLYLNRSRVGSLGGFLGTLARPIVQRRARAGLAKSLLQTKQRFEAGH